jgi:hypothetical protein
MVGLATMGTVEVTAATATAVALAVLAKAAVDQAVLGTREAAKAAMVGRLVTAMEEALAMGEVRAAAVDRAALAERPAEGITAEGLDQVAARTAATMV